MKEFFDTSVLVAAFLGDHPQHGPSSGAFRQAARGRSFCGAHSLAEAYAALTRIPLRPMIAPEQASLFLEEVRSRVTVVALEESGYAAAIQRVCERRAAGGAIYDALLLQCAIKAEADLIYTWNLRHFQGLAPELASRIRTP